MRRAVEDGLIAAAGLLLLLVLVVAVDQRVRERLTDAIRPGNPSAEIASLQAKTSHTAAVVLRSVKDKSIEQAPLFVFAAAAGGLFLAMMRL